ncbi:MAG TPA: hypothetical protein VMF69_14880 [Gemmataceae bacterium]|nr:hypothetical protein [Gemmataceae bacterium]
MRIVDKLDDLLNPIVVKELRQAVKSRIVVSALVLFLLIQLSILLVALSFGERRGYEEASLQAGRQIFLILQGILLGTCMLLVPAYAGVRLAAEHSDTNVDLLFISTLRPRGIIFGKLQASVVLMLLIFSACAPFMTFTYLLRGIDIPSIVMVLVLDFLVVLLCTQGAIFFGAVPANAGMKLLLGLFGLGLLAIMFGYTTAASMALLDMGLGSRLDSVEFWLIAGAVAVAILATVGLLFTWSVAIVSPASANRALPVRLYTLAFWIVTGAAAAIQMRRFRTTMPLYFWEAVIVTLLCTQIVVSINEREQWGLRIKRTIPRRWWLRGPAFLLYSGAAGGMLFAVLLIALTLVLASLPLSWWIDPSTLRAPTVEIDIGSRTTLALFLMALYTFDYCMLAVWLRNLLPHDRIKTSYTWVLAIILAGLGISLPWPLLFLFQNEELRMGHIDPGWQISNPFSSIFTCVAETSAEAEIFRYQCPLFLSGLALTLLLGCVPWMARQMRRFRPPEKETPAV